MGNIFSSLRKNETVINCELVEINNKNKLSHLNDNIIDINSNTPALIIHY